MAADSVREAFQRCRNAGDRLIGAAVGSGIASRHLLAGGADFLLIATGGLFRAAGVPSLSALLPMGNANAMIVAPAIREILPRAGGKPVVIGLCGADPQCRLPDILKRIREAGIHGVNNFPSVGFYDGALRQALEKGGFSYQREIELLSAARDMGFFTLAFVFNEENARDMARAGVDAVCANLNLPIDAESSEPDRLSVEDAAFAFGKMFQAARRVKPDIFSLFYCAGPLSTPDALDSVVHATGADGYMGGSVFERIPSAAAMEEITGQYKKNHSPQP